MDQDSGVDQAGNEQRAQGGLTDRQREMLDFERTWWQSDEPRDDLIRARFGVSTDEYYVELNQVLDLPGAMEHDPLVVRRFQRRRARRRRTLSTSSNVSQRGVSE
ncbi:DUF3263 domain-containing protein [Desertimonas flava]|jgi:hypothetical protein|uniref:DUF3263 domain-containing protein n=1 Tax=Desertimonas flava TaxID=2064846 RepID=UPI0013C42128|nr:DUF3263 domain-containing protein [Desertimonas flava]